METEFERPEFGIEDILPIALVLAVAGIGVAYTLQILGDIKTDMATGSAEANATQDAICISA
jgi:hypothetical protein